MSKPPKISEALEAARQTYQDLMVEAQIRLNAVNSLTLDHRGIPSPLVREFGALQVRMVCEIVALGCLVAHGDLVARAPGKLERFSAPGQIFAELEKLHNEFFPVANRPQRSDYGWHLNVNAGSHVATKSDVKKIWDDCGAVLHKGSLKKLVSNKTPQQNTFVDLSGWIGKLENLVNNHHIQSMDRNYALVAQNIIGKGMNVVVGTAIPKDA